MEVLKKTMMTIFAVAILMMPVLSIAGSLEPSAAPAPTMKTLDQIPPTWSQKLPGTQRFELVLDGEGVLDKETGLVWDKVANRLGNQYDWLNALSFCRSIPLGNRKGWHLPTVEQLASLVDINAQGSLKLPEGHPFLGVQSSGYWSATSTSTTLAYGVDMSNGGVYSNYVKTATFFYQVWCVRGGETDGFQ